MDVDLPPSPRTTKERKEKLAKEQSAEGELVSEIEDILNFVKQPSEQITAFQRIIAADDVKDAKSERVKVKEQAIYQLGKLLVKLGRASELKSLLVDIRPFFAAIPKGKTAKIVRTLIDLVGEIPGSLTFQAELCRESIEWCIQEKRSFLKQRIQARLANLYLKMKEFKEALKLVSKLVKEVKNIDDKLLMVEIELIASRVHHALQNLPAAKGSLTSARSNANAIYCPPQLQSEIDLQAGTLCAEEHDYKTAFSYFYEAFEGSNTVNQPVDATRALKYMFLSKIMTNETADVFAIINGKIGIRYAGIEVEAMRAIAEAHRERSIHSFEKVLAKYKEQLQDDPIIHAHLKELYDNLLEQNLIRIIEPFSRVQIPHVAKLINLPVRQVEDKLSEMILDQKFHGTLDQGSGDLIVFDDVPSDKTFEAALDTVKELNSVVDKLYRKAGKLRQ